MRFFFSIPILLSFLALPIHAQWQLDGIPLCGAAGEQLHPAAVRTSSGIIAAWEDYRSGNADIYAQSIGLTGSTAWTANGIAVCTAAQQQLAPVIAADNAGGVIIAWEDYRSSSSSADIYVQRISASGQPLWTAGGVAVCTANNVQMHPAVVSDGQGGAFVAWEDYRTNLGAIYVQHIASTGAVSWTANGVAAATTAGSRYAPTIGVDAGGNVLVAWENLSAMEFDIRAQRISSSGARLGGNGGFPVCTASGFQTQLAGIADGSGGLLLAWQDYRGTDADIYVQRVTANGPAWQTDGVAVCTSNGTQQSPAVASDGQGGVFTAWTDYRVTMSDIYAQHVSGQGSAQWTADGVLICGATGTQQAPQVASSGSTSLFTWEDYRVADGDVYAQRLGSGGSAQWQNAGAAVCTQDSTQFEPVVAPDGAGGAIVVWTDYRGQTGDIYVQRVDQSGTPLPVELRAFTGVRDGPDVRLSWETESEMNLHGFEVQSAAENGAFSAVGFVSARAPGGGAYTYTVSGTDASRFRLRAVDTDGSATYSPVLHVAASLPTRMDNLSIHPLPVREHCVIQFDAPRGIAYGMTVYDMAGRSVTSDPVRQTLGGRELHVFRTADWPAGTYILQISSRDGVQRVQLPVVR